MFKKLFNLEFLDSRDQRAYKYLVVFLLCHLFIAVVPIVGQSLLFKLVYVFTRGLSFLSLLCFALAVNKAPCFRYRYHARFKITFVVGLFWLLYCLCEGTVFNHERFGSVIAQASFFLSALLLIYFGGIRAVLPSLLRFFLVVFYLVIIFMFLTKDIHLATVDFMTGEIQSIDEMRNTDTLAVRYNYFLYLAPFFFFRGVFAKTGIGKLERIFSLGALVPFAYFLIGRNLYRTGIALMLLCFALALFYSLKKGKFVALLIVVAACLIAGWFWQSDYSYEMRRRIEDRARREQAYSAVTFVQSERGLELSLMLENVPTWKLVLGSGFGATYDASEMFGPKGYEWQTIHLGVFITLLYGGIGFFVYIIFLFVRGILGKQYGINAPDGLMLVCKCYVIVFFIRLCFVPFGFAGSLIFPDSLMFLSLGMLWSDRKQEVPLRQTNLLGVS